MTRYRRYLARRRHVRAIRSVYRPVLADLALLRMLHPEIWDVSTRQELVREILHDYRPCQKVMLAPTWAEELARDAS